MTTKTWNTGTADWYTSNGGDWNPAGDPGPSDDVVINSGEAELLSGDAGDHRASIPIGGSGFLAIQDPEQLNRSAETCRSPATARVQLDGPNFVGGGGSSLTIGGTLTNSSTNGNGTRSATPASPRPTL